MSSPKFDAGKAPVHLVVPEFILGIARILAFGAKKYAAWSWAEGKEWSRDYSASMRHLLMFWAGQDVDPETGESHLLHLACDTMFLFVSWLKGLGTDDRYKFPPDVLREMNDALKAVEERHAPAQDAALYEQPSRRSVGLRGGYQAFVAEWLDGKCAWCCGMRKPGERYFCTNRTFSGKLCGENCREHSSVEALTAACDYAEKHGVEAA